MLARMIRTPLLVAALALAAWSAPAAAAERSPHPQVSAPATPKVAKAGKKKKGAEKPAEKAVERPAEAPRDPRAGEPAPAAEVGGGGAGMSSEVRRGMARIEFDDRLIQGQTNKANAIYLFERRESALRSLLRKRTHFHEEIDETLE